MENVYEELTRLGWQTIFTFHASKSTQSDRHAADNGNGGTLPFSVCPRLFSRPQLTCADADG
jgi:hypothetical protein